MQTGNLPCGVPEDHGLKTLGWQVCAWIERHLRQPDGPLAGQPFRLTGEQLHFLVWWYAVTGTGRFVYTRGVLRRMKGWGKGPITSAVCVTELIGPCRFGGWDDDGEPIAVRHPLPWVQLAAVSQTQTGNTYDLVRAMVGDRNEVDGFPVDVGLTRIYAGERNERKLEPVTARSESLEGGRPSFVNVDEPHHMTAGNRGIRVVEVCDRNLAKSRDGAARMLLTTNAHSPGVGSAAEIEYDAFLDIKEGRARRAATLYDCVEGPDVDMTDEAALREALAEAAGDSVWLDLDRILDEIYNPKTKVEDSIRFYLNRLAAASGAWISPDVVKTALVADVIADGDHITLGFDGSISDDASALVAVRLSDGLVWAVKVWQKPDGPGGEGWELDREDVDRLVEWVFGKYDVVAFFSDLHPFESYVDKWAAVYAEKLFTKACGKHSIAFDMRTGHVKRLFTLAAEAAHAGLSDGSIKISTKGDSTKLCRHFFNAMDWPNRYGVGFGKEGRASPRKVDAAVSAVIALAARKAAIEDGILGHKRARKTTGPAYAGF
jgi:hypothetical protein